MPFAMDWDSGAFDMKLHLDRPDCSLRELVSEPNTWCLAAEEADKTAANPTTTFLSSPMKRKSYMDFAGSSSKKR
jgi:hypothetical protein